MVHWEEQGEVGSTKKAEAYVAFAAAAAQEMADLEEVENGNAISVLSGLHLHI